MKQLEWEWWVSKGLSTLVSGECAFAVGSNKCESDAYQSCPHLLSVGSSKSWEISRYVVSMPPRRAWALSMQQRFEQILLLFCCSATSNWWGNTETGVEIGKMASDAYREDEKTIYLAIPLKITLFLCTLSAGSAHYLLPTHWSVLMSLCCSNQPPLHVAC